MSDEKIICRCKEVTEEEIREAVKSGATTVSGVKRRTEAGMGLCQGRTCRKLVTGIIAQETGIDIAAMEMETARPPVRPVRVSALLETKECKCKGE